MPWATLSCSSIASRRRTSVSSKRAAPRESLGWRRRSTKYQSPNSAVTESTATRCQLQMSCHAGCVTRRTVWARWFRAQLAKKIATVDASRFARHWRGGGGGGGVGGGDPPPPTPPPHVVAGGGGE